MPQLPSWDLHGLRGQSHTEGHATLHSGPPQHSSSLLTRNGAGCGIAIDLLSPDQLLVQVDHLGEIVVSLQDLSWNRNGGERSSWGSGGASGEKQEEPSIPTPKGM